LSALKGLLGTREENLSQISSKLNDLVVEPEPQVLEVACQTVKDILSAQKVALGELERSESKPITILDSSSEPEFSMLQERVSSLHRHKQAVLQATSQRLVF
jgi:hypothetical protein